jgi:ABC-2 type transport system ATP-binding protein
MMKILTCYIPQSSGNAAVCGFDVRNASMEVRKRVGYLPEHNPLYLDMYVREYLSFGGGIYLLKGLKERVVEMIETVGLTKEKHKKIGALSKGYRQRVGLAQALIHDPEVLILDEPTSGLDPLQLTEIRQLIRKVGETKTVMLSTHIMQEVEAVCDRVIIINEGSIVADNTVSSILREFSTKHTLQVAFNGKMSEQELKTIKGVEKVQHMGEHRWRLVSEPGSEIQPKLLQLALKHQLNIQELQVEESNLESIFVSLTGKK